MIQEKGVNETGRGRAQDQLDLALKERVTGLYDVYCTDRAPEARKLMGESKGAVILKGKRRELDYHSDLLKPPSFLVPNPLSSSLRHAVELA